MTEPTRGHRYRSALISTAGHCAIACGFCFRADRAHGLLNVDTYSRALSRLKEHGVTGVCLTGGEPTHHPELRQLVRLAHQFGMPVSIVTSARAEPEVRCLEQVAHLLENATVSADSRGAMRLGRTLRSVRSAAHTLRRIGVPSAVLHLTYWNLTGHECREIADAVDKTGASLQLSPITLDTTGLRRAGLTPNSYAEQQQRDAKFLSQHFELGTCFQRHLDALNELNSTAERPYCRSPTLYLSATGELRRCPYGTEGVSVSAPRSDIARFLAGPPTEQATADCLALCRAAA
ncbi:radical SAM protein [Streptomyces sp. PTM05]|uniref:Radical SAM protein n=1 Tax=Streptantibioticus parmotrematis TaxID=2873249 RepID=A0ABS7QPV2_9ACTN|nr:radical SAM protein [Streptantibioticus parmotrematis]MBY8884776.1 radical SAM protein [Streptantibioticus parmotrematis]